MKKMFQTAALLLALCLCLCACVAPQQTEPEPSAEQTTQPTVEPTVQPTIEPTEATVEPAAEEPRSAFSVLPAPEVDPTSEFGMDLNVNVDTIDQYLGLSDAVYMDMRMLADPYDYAALGGNSLLTGVIEGFTVLPYPYLGPCLNMPEELGEGYTGPTLFSIDEHGTYVANYEESLAILERIFPKDKPILLMCGAGGYASMTKELLLNWGWDENLIYNLGGYWFYGGNHRVELIAPEDEGSGAYRFKNLDLIEIDFSVLTPVE